MVRHEDRDRRGRGKSLLGMAEIAISNGPVNPDCLLEHKVANHEPASPIIAAHNTKRMNLAMR